jgi:hypothetical protein
MLLERDFFSVSGRSNQRFPVPDQQCNPADRLPGTRNPSKTCRTAKFANAQIDTPLRGIIATTEQQKYICRGGIVLQ